MVQPSSSSLIITSMMMISINTNLRWVDVISRAGHRTGEHEGGDSLQLPGLELSVKIIIIVLRRSTIIDFCHHDNDKGFVNKHEEENHYQFDHHHLYRRGDYYYEYDMMKVGNNDNDSSNNQFDHHHLCRRRSDSLSGGTPGCRKTPPCIKCICELERKAT